MQEEDENTSPAGNKIIENFSKIPYTGESLFEDLTDGFSAFPWTESLPREFRMLSWNCGWCIDDWTENNRFRSSFTQLVCCLANQEVIYCEFNNDKMNESELLLFVDFARFLKLYCEENDIELCDW